MSGDQGGDKPEEKETNFYLITVKDCHDSLVPDAIDAVYDGVGDPGKPIADAISGGGWQCTEADKWVAELLQHTSTVMPAFVGALTDVRNEISHEEGSFPEGNHEVPKGHPHGLAWNRTWSMMRRNI